MTHAGNFSSQVPNLPPVIKGVTHLSPAERTKLWQAAQGLEATFTTFMLKDVKFGSTQPDGKQSFAADTFGDMFKQTLADQMARSDSTGLARDIYVDSAHLAEKSHLASTIHPSTTNCVPPPLNPALTEPSNPVLTPQLPNL